MAIAKDSPDLALIVSEARDIAKAAGDDPSTAHLLLAIFTVDGPADTLLRERGCDEDRILSGLTTRLSEPADSFSLALARARQLAEDCGSDRANGLHLLVALTRLSRSVAGQLLERTVAVPSLRTTALGYLTGSVPRRRPERDEVKAYARPSVVLRPAIAPATSAPPAATEPERDAEPATGGGRRPEHTDRAVPLQVGRYELDPRRAPNLASFGRNLSLLAARGQLDPALGRDPEVEEVLDILGKRRANNPLLVGEPGVGKTAIVEGLARRLVESGADRILVQIEVSALVAGTQLRGSFSERLQGIQQEVREASGRVVVFIDEMHMLVGAGATGEGPQDAANELKAALARGEFPCIGATTHEEFGRYVQGDAALERRFVPVLVREPSPREALQIVRGAAPRYEEHHGVRFSPEALEAATLLTARHVHDRCLPDKAFAAIDLAGSRARREGRAQVSRDDVARAVARLAGVAEERILQPDGDRFLALEQRLRDRIVGHAAVIAAIARAVRRNYAGFSGQRPLASFLFAGPSGVGKTETARVLAEEMFPAKGGGDGQPGALVRIDLSEYADPQTTSRLVGAAPGYVGYGEGGRLTEAVRRCPSCVVLLDEAEKAHPAVLQLLLQILEEGQLTDGRGRRVDFTSSVLVLATNAGATGDGARAVGFAAAADKEEERALANVRAAFPEELWARLDEKLLFSPLQRSDIARVAQLLLAESARRLREQRGIEFRTGPGLVEHLVSAGGFPSSLGARPMRQTIERLVESPLADAILAGRVRAGERLVALAGPSGVEFRKEA
ncbi:MAG: AAA family ATPase [Myxococcales bacterium]